jgi:hypothetical protein
MTDKAISWMKSQKALTSDKPFFICLRPTRPTPRRAGNPLPVENADYPPGVDPTSLRL